MVAKPRYSMISQFKDLDLNTAANQHGFIFNPAVFNGDNKLNSIKARYDRYTCVWMKAIVYPPKPNEFLYADGGLALA